MSIGSHVQNRMGIANSITMKWRGAISKTSNGPTVQRRFPQSACVTIRVQLMLPRFGGVVV
jgi:predicted metalloprotease